jgi:hypothetical protein
VLKWFFVSALDAGDFKSFGKLQFGARKKVMQEWLQMATHRLKIALLPLRKCRADGGPKQSKRVSTLGYPCHFPCREFKLLPGCAKRFAKAVAARELNVCFEFCDFGLEVLQLCRYAGMLVFQSLRKQRALIAVIANDKARHRILPSNHRRIISLRVVFTQSGPISDIGGYQRKSPQLGVFGTGCSSSWHAVLKVFLCCQFRTDVRLHKDGAKSREGHV